MTVTFYSHLDDDAVPSSYIWAPLIPMLIKIGHFTGSRDRFLYPGPQIPLLRPIPNSPCVSS